MENNKLNSEINKMQMLAGIKNPEDQANLNENFAENPPTNNLNFKDLMFHAGIIPDEGSRKTGLFAILSITKSDIENYMKQYYTDVVADGGSQEDAKNNSIEALQGIQNSIKMLMDDLVGTQEKIQQGIDALQSKKV